MPVFQSILSFIGGELSPYLSHRIDIDKHSAGCSRMENFLPLPFGGFRKRAGTELLSIIDPAYLNDGVTPRLVPFQASNGDRFLICFTGKRILVLNTSGSVIATLYKNMSDPRVLQFQQIGDLIFIADSSHFPSYMSYDGSSFSLVDQAAADATPWVSLPFTSYALNSDVYLTPSLVGDFYRCINAHNPSSNPAVTKPESGSNWTAYWIRITPPDYIIPPMLSENADDNNSLTFSNANYTSVSVWSATVGANILVGQQVSYTHSSGVTYYYRCIKELTLTSTTVTSAHPYSGTDKDIYWRQSQILSDRIWSLLDASGVAMKYSVGDLVYLNNQTLGTYYKCISAHTASLAYKPESGASWTTYWQATEITPTIVMPAGTTSILVTAAKDTFKPGHVGSYILQNAERKVDSTSVELKFTNNQASTEAYIYSEAIYIKNKWSVISYGTWRGTLTIQRSTDLGLTWVDFHEYKGNSDRNVSESGEERSLCMMRLKWKATTSEDNEKGRAELSCDEAFIPGVLKIINYVSSKVVMTTAVTSAVLQSSPYWSLGAFSEYNGYPAAVGMHDSRLVFGGTLRRPLSLWFSKTDDYLNFTTGTDDDSSIMATLASNSGGAINWIASQRRMVVGTEEGEWVFGSDTSDSLISPSNLITRRYSSVGSAASTPILTGESIIFLEKQRRRLREYTYDLTRESYIAADLTRLAEHITESGITNFCWQYNREPILWAVRADGVLLSFNYNRDEKIFSWARHTTADGLFKAVAVIRNDSDDDGVYFVVRRGSTTTIERMFGSQQAAQETGDVSDWRYLDCCPALSAPSGSGPYIYSIPTFLNGKTLTLYNTTTGEVTTASVSGGQISSPSNTVVIGQPISSTLTTLPWDTQTQTGQTLGRKKRFSSVRLSLFKSRGGKVEGNGKAFFISDSASETYSGWTEKIVVPGAYTWDVTFSILHDSPEPFTVLATNTEWETTE